MLLISNPVLPERVGRVPGLIGGSYALQSYLSGFIALALGMGGVISFFVLVWGGYEYITAGGDKEGTQKAVKRITSGLIGLVILLSSFAIISLVELLFGISLLTFSLPVIN